MKPLIKICMLGMLIMLSFTACKKAQEESAETAKETVTEMKANTIDAAKNAAAEAERAANEIAKAADQVNPENTESADKPEQ